MVIIIDEDFISSGIENFLDKLNDLETPLTEIGEMLLLSHRERHDDEISPDGTPWQELSEKTRQRKKKLKKHPDDILILDGYLRSNYAYQISDSTLEFGTNSIYAATHQHGDTERNIPARIFLGLSDSNIEDIGDIFFDFFDE